ncbi:MAG: biotin/lipoyl-containing protein, partial [Acidimicrobiia bacterium]
EPSGPGIRVDSGVIPGSQIPQAYDSLIAKLICYGSSREEATNRTLRALDEFTIEGVETTIPFHKLALSSEWFRSGKFSTKTVENELDLSQLAGEPLDEERFARASERTIVVEVGSKRFETRVFERPEGARAKPPMPDITKRAAHAGTGETIVSPMQGTIVKTMVEVGDEVKAGDAICVLEAMKMENLIVCHRDGVVKELRVKAGEAVQTGAVLAVIGPPEDLAEDVT